MPAALIEVMRMELNEAKSPAKTKSEKIVRLTGRPAIRAAA